MNNPNIPYETYEQRKIAEEVELARIAFNEANRLTEEHISKTPQLSLDQQPLHFVNQAVCKLISVVELQQKLIDEIIDEDSVIDEVFQENETFKKKIGKDRLELIQQLIQLRKVYLKLNVTKGRFQMLLGENANKANYASLVENTKILEEVIEEMGAALRIVFDDLDTECDKFMSKWKKKEIR